MGNKKGEWEEENKTESAWGQFNFEIVFVKYKKSAK